MKKRALRFERGLELPPQIKTLARSCSGVCVSTPPSPLPIAQRTPATAACQDLLGAWSCSLLPVRIGEAQYRSFQLGEHVAVQYRNASFGWNSRLAPSGRGGRTRSYQSKKASWISSADEGKVQT